MRQTQRLTVLMMILLVVLLPVSSCCTKPPTQRIDPALHFPVIPDPVSETGEALVTLIEQEQKVIMPVWYWDALVRYMLKTDQTRKQYEAWNKIIFEE